MPGTTHTGLQIKQKYWFSCTFTEHFPLWALNEVLNKQHGIMPLKLAPEASTQRGRIKVA